MLKLVQQGEVLTLADRRRHILLELPHELYVPLDRLLAELRGAGIVGVLSHPERNAGIMANPAVVDGLVDAGCLMQITAGSLLGSFGRTSQAVAEQLATRGLVHFVSTDAHGLKSAGRCCRPPTPAWKNWSGLRWPPNVRSTIRLPWRQAAP